MDTDELHDELHVIVGKLTTLQTEVAELLAAWRAYAPALDQMINTPVRSFLRGVRSGTQS